jgi:uncharacterized protein YjbJ (UPF0337 family)
MSSVPKALGSKEHTGRRTASSLTGLARQGIETVVFWQKLALDFSLRSNAAVAAAHSRMLDVAASQANAALETSVSLFAGAVNSWTGAVISVLDSAGKGPQTRQRCANWGRIEQNWPEYRSRVHERWDRLDDGDLDAANGRREELSSAIQRKYGISRDDAAGQLDEFARQQEDRSGHAISAGGD